MLFSPQNLLPGTDLKGLQTRVGSMWPGFELVQPGKGSTLWHHTARFLKSEARLEHESCRDIIKAAFANNECSMQLQSRAENLLCLADKSVCVQLKLLFLRKWNLWNFPSLDTN